MSDQLPPDVPRATPPRLKKVAASVIAIAAILGATSYGVQKIPEIRDTCRKMHACSPGPAPQIAPYNTAWMDGGATWDGAAHDMLVSLRAQYPDFDVNYIPGREYSDKDWLGHVKYRFEMSFVATPKWTGIFA
jgi:hypothetical protein